MRGGGACSFFDPMTLRVEDHAPTHPPPCTMQINPENYKYHRGLQAALLHRADLMALEKCNLPATQVTLTAEQVPCPGARLRTVSCPLGLTYPYVLRVDLTAQVGWVGFARVACMVCACAVGESAGCVHRASQ
jgi:hypothetical protein